MDSLPNETDAKGRPLLIIKVHQTYPINWTAEEHSLFDRNGEAYQRTTDKRIAATYIN